MDIVMNFKKIIEEDLTSMMDGIKNLNPSNSQPNSTQQNNVVMKKHGNSSDLAIYLGNELVLVTPHQKYAQKILELLKELESWRSSQK
jgi:hypothetical protein